MIFASKLAKLGKAENISCLQVASSPLTFVVFVSSNSVDQKTLTYSNKKYSLTKSQNKYNCQQIIGINQEFALARNNQFFSIIKVDNGS